MRGRELFSLAKPALLLGHGVLRVLPRFISLVLWNWVNSWNGVVGTGLRWMLAKRLASEVGENVFLGPDLEVRGWTKLSIGCNVSIHRFSYIDACGGIQIDDDVSIAHGCSILSFEHQWSDPALPIRDNPVVFRPVSIERDAWIGCGVRILAGVTIGTRTVIAAGAVVTRSIENGVIAAGVPARSIRRTSGETTQ